MKTLPLAEAIEILDHCTAVQVDGDSLVYPLVYREDDDERKVDGLCLLLTTAQGEERFATVGNESVAVDESGRIMLTNTEGATTKILPLVAQPVVEKAAA